jgi:co-chaperonin GroES (HSP10)
MKVIGKRLFIILDEVKLEEVKKEGVQRDFTPKVIKANTATIAHIGDSVTEGRFKLGDRIFIEGYPEKISEIPGEGSFTIISEESVISIL